MANDLLSLVNTAALPEKQGRVSPLADRPRDVSVTIDIGLFLENAIGNDRNSRGTMKRKEKKQHRTKLEKRRRYCLRKRTNEENHQPLLSLSLSLSLSLCDKILRKIQDITEKNAQMLTEKNSRMEFLLDEMIAKTSRIDSLN